MRAAPKKGGREIFMLSLLDAMSSVNPDEELGPGEDDAGKSQRKRERERQRRTEMAVAFNDLADILAKVDPDHSDAATTTSARRKKRRGSDANEDLDVSGEGANMTRLLLINRATSLLQSLHAENAELKSRLRAGEGREDRVRVC